MATFALITLWTKAFHPLQIVFLLVLVSPMAYIYLMTATVYEPYHRGFYCNDQSLKLPYKDHSVVSTAMCVIIWALLAIFFIVLVETLRSLAETGRREKPIAQSSTPWLAVELYRQFGYFALGAVSCLLFTEMSKYTIGRLRPHFLTLCQPDYSDKVCMDGKYEKYIDLNEDDVCLGLVLNGGTTTKKELHEARLSFLSGHASFRFCCATFLIVYLQSRLANFPKGAVCYVNCTYRTLKISRPFIQFGLIILAAWISFTRISDYFHHPMDIVTGAVVGVVFACLTLLVCADMFNKRSIFWKNFLMYRGQGQASSHPQDQTELEVLDTNAV